MSVQAFISIHPGELNLKEGLKQKNSPSYRLGVRVLIHEYSAGVTKKVY